MSLRPLTGAPFLLDPTFIEFPDPKFALRDPDGLLAIGGDLSPQRLLAAYGKGIFPWYSDGQPILWWSPDPRCTLLPRQLRISRSLAKTLKKNTFHFSLDQAFRDVMRQCAAPRNYTSDTWITREIQEAYLRLHRMGAAHSVEAWHEGELAGGLYGVTIGRVFFGESMFSRRSDASKAAFAFLISRLIEWNYQVIDCQVRTPHLISLGAQDIPRREFLSLLHHHCHEPPAPTAWHAAESPQ